MKPERRRREGGLSSIYDIEQITHDVTEEAVRAADAVILESGYGSEEELLLLTEMVAHIYTEKALIMTKLMLAKRELKRAVHTEKQRNEVGDGGVGQI